MPSSYLGGVQQRDQYPPHSKTVKVERETELEEGMVLSKIWTRKCLPYDQFVSLRAIMYFPDWFCVCVCRNKSLSPLSRIFCVEKKRGEYLL